MAQGTVWAVTVWAVTVWAATVLLSCASAAALMEEHGTLSSMLTVIVPDGAADIATMARLVNAAMVSRPRVSMIFRGFPTGQASELGWEGLNECDSRLPEGGEHVKVAGRPVPLRGNLSPSREMAVSFRNQPLSFARRARGVSCCTVRRVFSSKTL